MKKIFLGLALLGVLLTGTTYYFYTIIYSNQVKKEVKLFIRTDNSAADVLQQLDSLVLNPSALKKVASLKKYTRVKPGMYVLKKGMNANTLVNLLRSGHQTPVKVSFNNQNYIEDLAGRLAQQIEADSISILNSLTDVDFLEKEGFTSKTALHYCMPYTYDCYWNIHPDQLRSKLLKAYRRFWSPKKLQKAQELHLTTDQIIAVAAIVHKETQHKPERKKVAGVYLNRIKKRIPLQADPTVIYALKEKYGRDTIVKRVLRKDLRIVSPYNTYQTANIPPSAIAMPDVDAIEAVLNAEHHAYYYFCANPKKIGTHNFAKTLRQHNNNAKNYQRWLNKQHIHR